MIEFGQDIVVTLVAASAATVLGRRVFGAVRPAKHGSQPACPSCASGAAACAKPKATHTSPDIQPLTLVRKA